MEAERHGIPRGHHSHVFGPGGAVAMSMRANDYAGSSRLLRS